MTYRVTVLFDQDPETSITAPVAGAFKELKDGFVAAGKVGGVRTVIQIGNQYGGYRDCPTQEAADEWALAVKNFFEAHPVSDTHYVSTTVESV